MGFTEPTSHLAAGALLPHRSTLTRQKPGGTLFCGTIPEISLAGRYPALCPLELGLSSPSLKDAAIAFYTHGHSLTQNRCFCKSFTRNGSACLGNRLWLHRLRLHAGAKIFPIVLQRRQQDVAGRRIRKTLPRAAGLGQQGFNLLDSLFQLAQVLRTGTDLIEFFHDFAMHRLPFLSFHPSPLSSRSPARRRGILWNRSAGSRPGFTN